MLPTLSPLAVVGFPKQDCRNKSVATQSPQDNRLKSIYHAVVRTQERHMPDSASASALQRRPDFLHIHIQTYASLLISYLFINKFFGKIFGRRRDQNRGVKNPSIINNFLLYF